MKALVATTRTQGERPSDFSHTVPGELVYIASACARDRFDSDPDGGCGCGRAFIGLNTAAGTTTAEVRDILLSPEDYTEAIRSSLAQYGWSDANSAQLAADMLAVVDIYEPGHVLQRRLDVISAR